MKVVVGGLYLVRLMCASQDSPRFRTSSSTTSPSLSAKQLLTQIINSLSVANTITETCIGRENWNLCQSLIRNHHCLLQAARS